MSPSPEDSRLGPHVVGRRVVVRYRLAGRTGPSGRPALTDVLGTCTAWGDGRCTVRTADGTDVRVAISDIVAGKPVPPAPVRRGERSPGGALPGEPAWLAVECDRLLDFALRSVHPNGGFAWVDDDGVADLARPRELWITCRMTHVFAIASLLGGPASAEAGRLADHGVRALLGAFHDDRHGGWYAAVDDAGPTAREKTAYGHAFVVLAASSAVVAGRPGADALLEDALAVLQQRFRDVGTGMLVEEWDEAFTTLDPYRGVNANMHAVEALLAAADALGDDGLRDQATGIITRVVHGLAAGNAWRLPEHFDATWTALPDYHREQPAHPFRPYGATIGHAFEWARLTLTARAALGDRAPAWMLADARDFFDAAVRDGWAVDGADGFVYTVDWDGHPVVRRRMHWVAAEAVAAAAALARATGEGRYRELASRWWAHIDACLVDRIGGSWHHELTEDNRPGGDDRTWAGKPDVYHAFQATLLPRLPLAPTLARAVAEGLLDE